MEKVFIKPVAKEILIKGNGKEGSSDSFLYDYDSDAAKRALGNLYVVGNVQGEIAESTSEDLDVAYVINLVASLAKREYYSNPDLAPKDAFTAALKKINGVVEEFFKKKDTQINIGVFAIAGDQLHISKLGKFKILLARDGKNIDILNNVDLFDRESTQEKEFSNIISGKVIDGDRILAFYPNRNLTARSKALSGNFLNLNQAQFISNLQSIKQEKPDFACAAVHIDLQKSTEATLPQRIQPKEMLEVQASLAAQENDIELKPKKSKRKEMPTIGEVEAEPLSAKIVDEIKTVHQEEIPKIIPSEFTRGKKTNIISKNLRRFGGLSMNTRNKKIVLAGGAILLVAMVLVLKNFVFISAADRALSATVLQAQTDLKLANDKLSQNDLAGARSLLIASLSNLAQSGNNSDKISEIKNELNQKLDTLEGAVDANLTSAAQINDQDTQAQLVVSQGDDLYAYIKQGETGSIAKISNDGIIAKTEVKNISPNYIFSNSDSIVAVDTQNKKIASLSLAKSTIGTSTFSGDPMISLDLYQGNIYALTSSDIIKITDAATGHTAIQSWLSKNTTLASDPALIKVDGNLYVLSENGILTTYYKGTKKTEVNTPVNVTNNNMLLTTDDSLNLYLVNKELGRIYVIKKDTGSLVKTYKLNSEKSIQSATLDSHENLYILSENRVWKVQ